MGAPPGREPLAALHLIVFSRAPVAGHTKTRLSPPLTPEQARDLHAACLGDLLAAGVDWRAARAAAGRPVPALHLFITPPASQPAFRAAGVPIPPDYALHNQRGDTLGERMEHAIRHVRPAAGHGGADSCGVILVGSDLPLLGQAQWDAAAAALETADVVFGPTPDGGYYLVGTRHDPAGLFAVQGWGGSTVLAQSLAAARAAGRHPALIEPLPDADTVDDLRALLGHPLAAALAQRPSLKLIRRLLDG